MDVSNANLLVIEQAGELWFPLNKTQPSVVCKAIGSLLFPDFVCVYKGVNLGDLHQLIFRCFYLVDHRMGFH